MRTTTKIVALGLLLTAVFTAPPAAADHVDEEIVHEHDGRYLVVEAHDHITQPPPGDHIPVPEHVAHATVEVWEESNTCEGLQQTETDCDGDGVREPSDTLVDRVTVTLLRPTIPP